MVDDSLEIGMFNIEWSKTTQHKKKDMWLAVLPASTESMSISYSSKAVQAGTSWGSRPMILLQKCKKPVKTPDLFTIEWKPKTVGVGAVGM